MRKSHSLLLVTAFAAIAGSAKAADVYSNVATGDSVSGPLPVTPLASNTGFRYSEVRVDSSAGINTLYPRSGNGSFAMSGTSANAKSDLEYNEFFKSGNPSMGTLASLSSFSYDWYRASSSTVAAHLHPSLRLLFDADGNFGTTNDRGALIFERTYNGLTTPVDTWTTDGFFNLNGSGNQAKIWMSNFGNPNGSVEEVYNRTLSDWLTTPNPNAAYPSLNNGAVVYGFNVGFGSGWAGNFTGAADNVTIGFGSSATTYNFEVAPVPEPATMAALGLGALGVLRRRARRK